MSAKNDFLLVFKELKAIFKPYATRLTVAAETPTGYSLDGSYSRKYKKKLFFGSVHIMKNYVSLYLMPVYMYPDLLNDISPLLKKRLQGKSCFHFKKVEPELFRELAVLTEKGYERFRQEI